MNETETIETPGERSPDGAEDRGAETDDLKNGEPDDEGSLQRQSSAGLPARAGLAVVRFYQNAISPLFPPSCRFQPSCSEYAKRAIEKHGLLKGGWLGAKRILKCHPFHPGGHDPVP